MLYKLSDNLTQALTRPFLVQVGFDAHGIMQADFDGLVLDTDPVLHISRNHGGGLPGTSGPGTNMFLLTAR